MEMGHAQLVGGVQYVGSPLRVRQPRSQIEAMLKPLDAAPHPALQFCLTETFEQSDTHCRR
jgi:hypothetical protein|tara:strand:+ start:1878 stop:2060 length:183 start_codon:yes stop_codon:yes gene_type:complete